MDFTNQNIDLSNVPQPEYFDLEAWKREQLNSLPPPVMSTPTPIGVTGAPIETSVAPVPTPTVSPEYRTMLDTLNPPTVPAFTPPVGGPTSKAVPTTPAPKEAPFKGDAMGNNIEGERKFATPSGIEPKEASSLGFIKDMETQSSNSSQSTQYDPKDMNTYDKAINNVKDAQERISGIMKSVSDDPEIKAQIGKSFATSASIEDMLDPNSENFKAFNTKLEKTKNDMDKADADLAEFQQEVKIDPTRYYKQMSNTSKALTALAAILESTGAMMAAQGGLQLPTGVISKQLQEGIDRDIALQKDEMNNKEKGLATEANRYAKNFALLKDERAAELKTKVDLLTASKTTLEVLRSKYDDLMNSAEADKMTAGLDMELAKTTLDLKKRIVSNNTQTTTKLTPIPTAPTAKQIKENADAEEAVKGVESYQVSVYGKGSLEAYSKDEAKELRADLGSYESLMGLLETTKELDKQEGWANPGTGARALGDALANEFLLIKKNLEKLGVLSESDKDIVESLLSNPTKDSLRRAKVLIENQLMQATNKVVSNINTKTKVGSNRMTSKDLYTMVAPLAKQRARETLDRALGKTEQQMPKTKVQQIIDKRNEDKINK